MNNQNIQNLVEFIRKNPSLSPSQLEESALKVGYSREEFSQALEIISKPQTTGPFSQNVASANQEALTQEQNKQHDKTLLFAFLVIFILLILGSVAGFYLLKQSQTAVEVAPLFLSPSPSTFSNILTPTSEPFNQPTIPVSESDPMKIFSSVLSITDYKVTTNGKFENKKQESGGTQTSSLDLNNGTVYVQKGSVVRIDKTDPQEPEIAFIKGDRIYILNPKKKAYTILNSLVGQFYLSMLKTTFPLIPLLDDTQKGIVSWQKIDNNEWQADWKWKTPLDPKETPVKVKVNLDTATNLITTLSMKFEESQPWQDAIFKYETVENIESFLTAPSDYKEEKLGF